MENLLYLLISLLAASGFAIAFNIHSKKASNTHLACPLRGHCDAVVKSEYSNFLGIPLEYIGMVYYAVITISYLLFFIFPQISVHNFFVLGVVTATASAFIFSLYLTAIQAFVLKIWCTWCIVSAFICTAIFFLVVQISLFDMIPYLAEYKRVLIGMHLVGVVLGFGAALIADIFFFKSARNGTISENESEFLKTLSQIIWGGILIIVSSGFLIFLSNSTIYSNSDKFLVKMFVVGIIVFNGILLHVLVSPNLTKIPFGKIETEQDKKMRNVRKIAFGLGAISATSWWTAFILGLLKFSPAPFGIMLAIYLTILSCAVIGSQIMEEVLYFIKKRRS